MLRNFNSFPIRPPRQLTSQLHTTEHSWLMASVEHFPHRLMDVLFMFMFTYFFLACVQHGSYYKLFWPSAGQQLVCGMGHVTWATSQYKDCLSMYEISIIKIRWSSYLYNGNFYSRWNNILYWGGPLVAIAGGALLVPCHYLVKSLQFNWTLGNIRFYLQVPNPRSCRD